MNRLKGALDWQHPTAAVLLLALVLGACGKEAVTPDGGRPKSADTLLEQYQAGKRDFRDVELEGAAE